MSISKDLVDTTMSCFIKPPVELMKQLIVYHKFIQCCFNFIFNFTFSFC